MINILAFSASPVDNSSTEILVKQVAHSANDALVGMNSEVRFINLHNVLIKPCKACGESPAPDFCVYDDIDSVYEQIISCDALIFGSPVYFDSVSAQAKLLIDRTNCFRPPDFDTKDSKFPFIKRLNKKRPGIMVIVGGEDSWYEGARRVLAGFFKWIEVTNEGMIQFGSQDYNLKGSVNDDTMKINEAKKLGKLLAEKIKSNR